MYVVDIWDTDFRWFVEKRFWIVDMTLGTKAKVKEILFYAVLNVPRPASIDRPLSS